MAVTLTNLTSLAAPGPGSMRLSVVRAAGKVEVRGTVGFEAIAGSASVSVGCCRRSLQLPLIGRSCAAIGWCSCKGYSIA